MNQQEANQLYAHYLNLNLGGSENVDLYFNIEADEDDDWWVMDDYIAFYGETEVTNILDPQIIDTNIQLRVKEVEEQMAENRADAMIHLYQMSEVDTDDIPF